MSTSPSHRLAQACTPHRTRARIGSYDSFVATFVLVHGACHGGWCWDAVVAALRAGGHDAGIITEPGRALADLATVDGDRDLPLDAEDFTSFPDGTFVFTEHGARRA